MEHALTIVLLLANVKHFCIVVQDNFRLGRVAQPRQAISR